MEYVTSKLPAPKGAESIGFSGADFLTVSAQTDYPQLATEMALQLSQGNYISSRINTLLPFYKKDLEALLKKHPDLKTFIRVMENATTPPPHPKWVSIQENITKAVEATLLRRGSPDSNLAEAQKEINKIIEEYQSS